MRHDIRLGRRWRWREGFTLIEMLVVLGIIMLLMGMLLPMVTRARKAAETTKCLAQLREIGILFSKYTSDYDHEFPPASMTNSKDSPYSPHGLEFWKKPIFYPWVGKPIMEDDSPPTPQDKPSPPAAVAWSNDPMRPAAVAAPIGWYFMRSAGDRPGLWICPSQERTVSDGFRTNDYVQNTSLADDPDMRNAFTGYLPADEWKPGYMYMATREYQYFINAQPTVAAKYHMRDLIVRNIAGLSLSQMRPAGGGNEASVVTFTDYSVRAHSRGSQPDLYDLGPGQSAAYVANFLYLDGHVETKTFRDFDSYLSQFHRGINQVQYNLEYAKAYAAEMQRVPNP